MLKNLTIFFLKNGYLEYRWLGQKLPKKYLLVALVDEDQKTILVYNGYDVEKVFEVLERMHLKDCSGVEYRKYKIG